MSTKTTNLKLFKYDKVVDVDKYVDIDEGFNNNWDKIDEVVGKNTTAISTIEKKNTTQDEQLIQLEKEKAVLQEQVTLLDKNQLSGVAEGESITVKDSSDYYASIGVEGNDKQETRSGSNLFNFNKTQNSKVTVNNDGTLTINGTGGFGLNFVDTVFKQATKYYINYQVVSGTVTNPTSAGEIICSISGTYLKPNTFNEYTPAEDTTRASLWIHKDAVFTNAVIKIWCNTDKSDFEQYGAMPSIDYLSEVQAVGDNINIFDSSLMTDNSAINFIDLQVKPNTAYTFSTNIPKTYDGSNAYIFATNRQHGYTTAGNGVWEGQTRTIISDNDGYISLAYRKDSNISSYDDYWYKIEKGTKATNWSKYGQGNVETYKCNKNVLKIDDGNKRSNGITTIAKDGILILNGTCTTNWVDITNINKNKIKPGTYIFSKDTNKYTVILRVFYEDGKMTDFYLTKTSFNSKCIISKNVRSYYLFITLNKDETIDNEEIKVQLETSDTATDIILHQEEIYTLPIQKPMLKGDYFDLVNKKEVHNIKELVLTGDESNWEIYIQNGIVQFFNKSLIKTKSQFGICTHFNATSIAPIYVKEDIGKILMYRTLVGFGIFLDVTEFPTLDVFKERLRAEYTKGTPVKLYYDSTTPTELDLTEEQIAVLEKLQNTKTYKNVTHVDSDDIAILKLDYKKDTETVVNDMQAQIDEIKTLLSTTSTSALLLDNMQTDLESEV